MWDNDLRIFLRIMLGRYDTFYGTFLRTASALSHGLRRIYNRRASGSALRRLVYAPGNVVAYRVTASG